MRRDGANDMLPAVEGATASGERKPRARRSLIPAVERDSAQPPGRSLGAILVDAGKLTVEETERILQFQREDGSRFGQAALKLGLISKTDLHLALAEQFDYPYLPPGDERIAPTVISAYRPFDPTVETFRALRAQVTLRWLDIEDGGRAIAIVSPGRGEGRSYLAANLAVVFAQLGERTLLIDADMRNPQQHALFRLNNRTGLSAILAGRGEAGSIERVASFRELSIIPAGALPPNPQELLARPSFSQLLAELGKRFSIIIVDTPAGGSVADVRFICRSTRAALMILRKNYTRVKAANSFLDELGPTKARVVGTVLNEF